MRRERGREGEEGGRPSGGYGHIPGPHVLAVLQVARLANQILQLTTYVRSTPATVCNHPKYVNHEELRGFKLSV